MSEMFWGGGPEMTAKELQRVYDGLAFTTFSQSAQSVIDGWKAWPKYKSDKFYGKYPGLGNVKLLISNGDLDPQTPFYWASDFASH